MSVLDFRRGRIIRGSGPRAARVLCWPPPYVSPHRCHQVLPALAMGSTWGGAGTFGRFGRGVRGGDECGINFQGRRMEFRSHSHAQRRGNRWHVPLADQTRALRELKGTGPRLSARSGSDCLRH